MRILIITGIFPPDIGGPATYVPQIAEALFKRGHQITTITLSDRLGHDDEKLSFKVIRISRGIFKPWRWLFTIFTILRLCRGVGVLFVNGLAMEAAVANLIMRKPMVQKVVGDLAWERTTNLGWVRDNFEDFQKKKYGLKVESLKAIRSWWTRKADRIIVPSQYLARWVRCWKIPDQKVTVIYNSVTPANGIEPTAVPLKTPIKLVTVGRLVPWKRIDKIMESIVQLGDVGLIVVGDGPDRVRLENEARVLGILERVYFANQRSNLEVRSLMAAGDVFVLNSSYEGFPHILLEAMSLGLPIVATGLGGTPEVVRGGQNGFLISPKDTDGLYKIILKLISFPSLRHVLGEGAKLTATRFGIQRMVEETEAILLNCKLSD